MPYSPPTVDAFLEAYPAFAAHDPAQIERAIVEAARYVDSSWNATDYDLAIGYMIAHLLTVSDDATMSVVGGGGGGSISSESLGGISVSYGKAVQAAGSGSSPLGLDETSFGRSFKRLALLNRGGPRVVR